MPAPTPPPGPGRRVYHSTQADQARTILAEGFRLDQGEFGFGSSKGRGVYCAPSLIGAAPWVGCGYGAMLTLACRLKPGLRIAWVEPDYDRDLVARLQREFGRAILANPHDFAKALPKNKQLTKNELLALVGYFFHTRHRQAPWGRVKRWSSTRQWWRQNFAHLKSQLARHQFEAIGDRSRRAWDSDEIVVFNPAHITPVSVHRLDLHGWDLCEMLPPPGQEPRLGPVLGAAELDTLATAELLRRQAEEEAGPD